MDRRGGWDRGQAQCALNLIQGGMSRTSDLDPPESTAWCVPASELQALIDLLAGPAVLAILKRLAVAPCQHTELCAGVTGPRADVSATEAALVKLRAVDLIELSEPPTASPDALQRWWSLTVHGQELLWPLSGLAAWYVANRNDLEGTPKPWAAPRNRPPGASLSRFTKSSNRSRRPHATGDTE